MSYVPVTIDPAESDQFSMAFGISEERYDEVTDIISEKLNTLGDSFTKSSMCKLFVDEAQSEGEAVMLAFMAGSFLTQFGSKVPRK